MDTCCGAKLDSKKIINENTLTAVDTVRLGRHSGPKTQEISGLIHTLKSFFFLIAIKVRHATCAAAINHCMKSSNTTVIGLDFFSQTAH